jgi:predicted MPP superfamily phosphohydrolase
MTFVDTVTLLLTLFYNTVLLAVDVAAWRLIRSKPSIGRWVIVMFSTGIAAVVLAAVMAVDAFAFVRWLSYGLFGHTALLLILSAFWLRKTSRLLSSLCGAAAIVLWAIAFDAFLIEPTWLEVSHRQLASGKLARPVRIVVVADLQADQFGNYERRVLRLVAEQKPDLLLFAGDYVQLWDAEARMSVTRHISTELRKLELTAPLGMFAIRGNVDDEGWRDVFAGTDVTVVESTQTFELDELRLTCLSLADSRNTQLSIENGRESKFHILLGHSPDFALGKNDADLLLAGHTHGGQVRLPFIGPLLTLSRVPRSLAVGMNELSSGTKLLVSRGIGVERGHAPRMRFLCRPELVVIDLVPKAEE